MAHARSGGHGHHLRSSLGRWGGWSRPYWGYSDFGGQTEDSPLISWIQSCLTQLVGPWVPQTGRLGRATRHAIRTFQSQLGIPVTGVPDSATIAQLQNACAGRRSPDGDAGADPANSSQGMSGEVSAGLPPACNEDRCTSSYIAWVQQSLNQLGNHLNVTGLLDRTTINAINQFKQEHKISLREYYASPLIDQALVQAGATAPPPARRLACGPTDLSHLLPLLRQYASDIPPEYLLAWITVESGGKLGDLTKICERGYFQIHPEESQDLKLDHDRLSTDPSYSVEGGIKLVRKYVAKTQGLARQFGISEQGDFFWSLVKLMHWLPSASARILVRMRKSSVSITDWSSIRNYVNTTHNLGFGSFDPRAGVNSVDHYLAMVARWRKLLAGGATGTTTAGPQQGSGRGDLAGGETEAIRSSIQSGVRDENRLTDLVFNARHPERRGQSLKAGDRRLAKEWLEIRASLVRPELGAPAQLSAAPVAPASRPVAQPNSTTSGVEAAGVTTHIIPCIAGLQDQGRSISFVQRYLRDLSRAEVAALKSAGLKVVSCYEEGVKGHDATNMSYFTRAQGQHDGRRGFTQAQAVGQPADRPVYFAVDADPNLGQKQVILDYVQGLSDGYGQYLADMRSLNKQAVTYSLGVYGSGCVLEWCRAQGLARWFWQAFAPAWCNNRNVWLGANIHTSGRDRPERCQWRLGRLEGWGNEGGW
jgi:peptidoglycan hydrolase-like protein with peptidoglycan-binding domain